MIFLTGWLAGIVFAIVHLLIRKAQPLDKKLEIFILYQVVFTIGLAGVFGFIGHCIFFEHTAQSIGWMPHKQFQFELGASELGWAIAGFLAILIRRPLYWLGVSIIPATMLFLAGCQHMQEVVVRGNYAPGNLWAGLADFIVPLTLLVLFIWYFRLTSRSATTRESRA
jgi:hypothetical protein